MLTLNDVYNTIKWMSTQELNPRPVLDVKSISREMRCTLDNIMPYLKELQQLRLIKFNDPAAQSIKLTLLGFNVDRNRP